MSKPIVERRFSNQEFRVSPASETPLIEGYAAVTEVVSSDFGGWTEILDAHAFDSVLASNPDVMGLINHDPNLVLGRTTSGTMQLTIDSRGLAYSIQPPDTTFARDLMVSMRRKDISGASFGFICARDQWTDMPDGSMQRRILEFDSLVDASIVTYPAYTAASSAVRSMPSSMPIEMRSKLEHRDNANKCACDCPECVADGCAECSNTDCGDTNCLANQCSRSKKFDAERSRMEMQLALLK